MKNCQCPCRKSRDTKREAASEMIHGREFPSQVLRIFQAEIMLADLLFFNYGDALRVTAL